MTAKEMHIGVMQLVQRMGSYDFSDQLGEEIDLQLNRAQDRFVKQRFDISLADPLSFEETQKRIDDIRTVVETKEYNVMVTDQSLYKVDNVTGKYYFARADGKTEVFNYDSNYNYLSNENNYTAPTKWTLKLPNSSDSTDTYWFMVRVTPSVRNNITCDATTAIARGARIVRNNHVTRILNHPYAKSVGDSPVATINEDLVTIYGDGVFDIVSVELEYIRQPRRIKYPPSYTVSAGSSAQSQNCELPEHTHEEIVDLTAQHISMMIQSPNYQQQVVERVAQE